MNSKSILIPLAMALASVCTKRPVEPVFLNPFDPGNVVFAGNPLAARAEILGGGVLVRWNPVQLETVSGYSVYRRTDSSAVVDWVRHISVNVKSHDSTFDSTVKNGHVYRYSVTAYGEDGAESAPSEADPLAIPIRPVAVLNSGDEWSNRNPVDLTVLAASAAEMCIGNQPDFAGSAWEPFRKTGSWTLTEGDGIKIVYVKVRGGNGTESQTACDSILLDTTKPFMTCRATPDTGYNNGGFTFNATDAGDNMTDPWRLQFRFGSERDQDWTHESMVVKDFSAKHGIVPFRIECRDLAGNVADTTLTVYVNSYPVANFGYCRSGSGGYRMALYPTGTDEEDPASECRYRWDLDGDSEFETDWMGADTVTHDFGGAGVFQVRMEMKDTCELLNAVTKTILIPEGDMVYVPRYPLQIGCGSDGPTVTIGGFWIDRFEVTVTEFAAFLNALNDAGSVQLVRSGSSIISVQKEAAELYRINNRTEIQYDGTRFYCDQDRLPVRSVPVAGMVVFAAYHGKRLPTALEWEQAARAASSRTYPWGDEPPDPNRCNSSLGHTVAVGSYSPEGDTFYGCCDMAGNLAEAVTIEGEGVFLRGGDFWCTGDREPLLRSCDQTRVTTADCPHGWGYRCVVGADQP